MDDVLPRGLSPNKRKQVRRLVLSKCNSLITQAAHDASHKGKWIKDPWGRSILAVPRMVAEVFVSNWAMYMTDERSFKVRYGDTYDKGRMAGHNVSHV
jgi:hypothetical protein